MPQVEHDVKTRRSFSAPGGCAFVRWVRKMKEAVMKDDMRLKSVTIKGANKYDFACLDDCTQSDCPCNKLKKWLSSQPKTAELEIEWMHVPTWKTVVFWRQMVFPIVMSILIVGILLALKSDNIRIGDKSKGEDAILISIESFGYRIEQKIASPAELEAKTNDLIQIRRTLKNVMFGL